MQSPGIRDKKTQHGGSKMTVVVPDMMKFRHELKYYINMSDYMTIRSRLSLIASADRHVSKNGTYLIRSLYFETPTDRVLREKIDGVNNREKFRIRLYNNDPAFIRLEKKTKTNGLCNKISAPLTQEQCRKIINGDTDFMKESPYGLVRELAAKMTFEQLRPQTIVDYTREAFVYGPGNVRITLDSDIRTGIRSTDIFNPELPTVRTTLAPTTILEVKYDEFLPEIIREVVRVQNRKQTAFSKYAIARMFG